MKTVIITYCYSELNKQHEYGVQLRTFIPSYNNWVWYGIGQIMPVKCKFALYPYLIEGEIIYQVNVSISKTSADALGRRIAKKILSHYAKVKK